MSFQKAFFEISSDLIDCKQYLKYIESISKNETDRVFATIRTIITPNICTKLKLLCNLFNNSISVSNKSALL